MPKGLDFVTKVELIDQMAESTGFPKQHLDRFLSTTTEAIQSALQRGEKAVLTGWASLASEC